ncbi:DUF485 domain-containing protein [Paenibacillus medicaginis]|uniref:DUF485 domain-containing protein n=1 Tax=Paenibacillus medicaginis TaxID=1470560 RepID=A0ABV5BZP6_9BACL
MTYSEAARTEIFRNLMAKKKRFIIPLSVFFLAFYFTLPILTSYSDVLNQPAFGSVTWAWVFAFAQFIMTWVLCYLYSRQSVKFDAMCNKLRAQATPEERGAGPS